MTQSLLGGQAAGPAVPWLCQWHQPLALLWGVCTGRICGTAMALATRGTHTLALTSPSIPVLSHTEPHTGVPSCLLREEQTLTCEAEFMLKIVIVPQGMNPTLFFHFPAVLLFFSSCPSLSVSLPQRGQPFTLQFPATWCAL